MQGVHGYSNLAFFAILYQHKLSLLHASIMQNNRTSLNKIRKEEPNSKLCPSNTSYGKYQIELQDVPSKLISSLYWTKNTKDNQCRISSNNSTTVEVPSLDYILYSFLSFLYVDEIWIVNEFLHVVLFFNTISKPLFALLNNKIKRWSIISTKGNREMHSAI